jgi:Tfp pilus assembly protein PilN
MNELDFLPDWYRAGRRRKQRHHRHYVLFGLIVALLAGWSFMLGRSVAGLKAQNRQIESVLKDGQQSLQSALALQSQIDRLSRQNDILAALTPRTAVSVILGELSHCVNPRIIFNRVVLNQEPIKEAQDPPSASETGVIRIGGSAKQTSPSVVPTRPQQTALRLSGIAADAADAAQLIEHLENSAYFKAVAPAFSRAKTIDNKTVTEFEIVCAVADYEILRDSR